MKYFSTSNRIDGITVKVVFCIGIESIFFPANFRIVMICDRNFFIILWDDDKPQDGILKKQ